MPAIDLDLQGDNAWPDMLRRRVFEYHGPWQVAALEGGMKSLAAWIAATCALRGRFPDAFQGTPLEAPDA